MGDVGVDVSVLFVWMSLCKIHEALFYTFPSL